MTSDVMKAFVLWVIIGIVGSMAVIYAWEALR